MDLSDQIAKLDNDTGVQHTALQRGGSRSAVPTSALLMRLGMALGFFGQTLHSILHLYGGNKQPRGE